MQKNIETLASALMLWAIYTLGVWAGWDILALPIRGLPLLNPLQAGGLVLLVAFLADLISGVADR